MKQLFIALVLVVTSANALLAQTERLNDYSFVVVPKRFDFQFEEDQYQLNSLLKFLFNKYGFHAYFENELPDTSRCDGLWVEIARNSGFIWTELTIVLKDCDGVILYKSIEGKSKLKEYGAAYKEALRMAFESISVLGVQQKDIRVLVAQTKEEKVETPIVPKSKTEMEVEGALHLPSASYTNYKKEEKSYLLKKTKDGYALYEEHPDAEEGLSYVGKLFLVEDMLFFEASDKTRYLAEFDAAGNLNLSLDGKTMSYSKN